MILKNGEQVGIKNPFLLIYRTREKKNVKIHRSVLDELAWSGPAHPTDQFKKTVGGEESAEEYEHAVSIFRKW